jgi:hypothetical protein
MASGVSRSNRQNPIPVLYSAAYAGLHTRGFGFTLLFSAIKKPKMIGPMAIITEPVKAATPFGCRKMLNVPLLSRIESGHLS